MVVQKDIQSFIDKVKKLEKGEQLDLSSGEDLSIGVMNLISLEEHLFFTIQKTGQKQYYELLNEIRKMRVELLKKIIKSYGGEVWCMSKHLLAASMRLMEVGTKLLKQGKLDEAEDLFNKSYQLYSLFWGLNLGLVKGKDVKAENTEEIPIINEDKKPKVMGSTSIFDKLGKVINKILDCCRE